MTGALPVEDREGIAVLRMASATGLFLSVLFIVLFDRTRHDPELVCVNPFAVDPYDAVGSFGVQLALAAGVLSAARAFRPAVPGESFAVRQTFILRAIGVSQLSIAVTMLADIAAMALAPSMWYGTPAGGILIALTAGLLAIPLLLCALLIRIARRSGRCSQNPLGAAQMVPFTIILVLLVAYPPPWREGIGGALLTAAFGAAVLLLSVALLSKAMFPCPDVPDVDLIGDLLSIRERILPRAPGVPVDAPEGRPRRGPSLTGFINPRVHPWRLIVALSALTGLLLALAQFAVEGPPKSPGRALLVVGIFLLLESGGVCFGYLLLRHFLGIFKNEQRT
ncbi:MAG TPA: hypothetical protein VML00_02170 [Bacteroidota bacterium]|nr:hypothetical protein [Bacteroidota bacterium]